MGVSCVTVYLHIRCVLCIYSTAFGEQ
ncbi:hypothetical protein KUCAC02_034661 [Chaenocephalus aceratus]|nr:hypothetical protein KUCAC02_034661 [Chaenocephalus aceratus]